MEITPLHGNIILAPQPSVESHAKTVGQTGTTNGKPIIFVEMEELLVEGERKTPGVLMTDARRGLRFSRLFDLKKSFLPMLEKTGAEKGLK